MVKNWPTMQETQFQSLDWKDPLEKEMATHSSIRAWKIPWTEELDSDNIKLLHVVRDLIFLALELG